MPLKVHTAFELASGKVSESKLKTLDKLTHDHETLILSLMMKSI